MRRTALALLLLALPASAGSGDYEQRLEEWGLSLHGREREPAPEGLVVEEVVVAAEEVLTPDDVWPSLFNLFHLRTREHVIRREVLLPVGQPYRAELAAETERNLRELFIFAISRVVPVKGRAGGVAVLVVTKDRWSLRFNSEFNVVGDLLQYLRLRPTEQNFLGLNKQLTLDYELRLDRVSLGQLYVDPRVLGGPLRFGETVVVVFNRASGRPEGTLGEVAFGLPLRTLDDRWGFEVKGGWDHFRRRIFRGPWVWQLPYPEAQAQTGVVPYVYDVRVVDGSGVVTRSFGRRFKLNASAGVGGYGRRYLGAPDEPVTEEQRAWLASRYLPRSEDALYLTAVGHAYEARYEVMRDLDSFALSEDVQLGYSVRAVARWAEPVLFADSRFMDVGLAARYRLFAANDLLSLTVALSGRHVPGATGVGEEGAWVNRRLAVELLNYLPPFHGGRLVTRALVQLTADDLDHRQLLLGGGNGLRGAPPEVLAGRNLMLFNVEYRARPVEILSLFWGFVLFYDAGAAYDESPAFTHTAGFGTRILVPQWNQETIRIDFGLVINQSSPASVDRFSASFGQVTDYRPRMLTSPLE